MPLIEKKIELAGRTLSLQVGKFAPNADSAVLARYGDTMVLATVCWQPSSDDIFYFPLTVDYVERWYAGGKISTSRFIKREARPSEKATLTSRLIDRSLRPLFSKDYFNAVQVVVTVLSVDQENDPQVLSVIAASAALACSSVPWKGPIGAVRIGHKDGSLILNPQNGELATSDLDLVVSATQEGVVMVEAGASQVEEEVVVSGLKMAQKEIAPIIDLIEDLVREVSPQKQKYEVVKVEAQVKKEIISHIHEHFLKELSNVSETLDDYWGGRCETELAEVFGGEVKRKEIAKIFEAELKKFVREKILSAEKRLDGRSLDQIRPIEVEVGVAPRTHGSAIFRRGDTQVLTVVTLGSPSVEQLVEGMSGEETKRYMHHYNFPPFSVGEVGRLGAPGRREIGHGALAEKALLPVVPPEETFPYTIRVVSEVLSSAGSTSQASVCGSTLALMDAGVPINAPVAGIAMGLFKSPEKKIILTDIGYAEDAWGDMDFKVAGTRKGITALQMDIKLSGVAVELLAEVLEKAQKARLFILDKIAEVLPQARPEISVYAPKIMILHINPAKIGEVIGPGGRVINKIIRETGAAIDIDDDGTVTVSAKLEEEAQKALDWISGLTREFKPGEVFEGVVKRILPFGAMVEVLPGKEGLVHISQLAPSRINRVEDVASVGQKLKVRVLEIDNLGRVNLSAKFGGVRRPFSPQRRF